METTTVSDLSDLIQQEAELLDAWDLEAWLDLYSDDAKYLIPIDNDRDPRSSTSIVFDDKTLLKMRVHQLIHEERVAQVPRSEYVHFITGIKIAPEGEQASAHYNLLVIEMRIGDWRQTGIGEKRLFVGKCKLKFRRDLRGWLITEKRISLLDRAQPIEGLSFIL
jgi:3-phenylpropionate/cinnamic acid dioxygenase small subunit